MTTKPPPVLLHVSDIHAAAGQMRKELAHEIAVAARTQATPTHLVASGDLGLKGCGSKYAADLLRLLAQNLNIPETRIVVCPGNHEVQTSTSPPTFSEYKEAVYSLTHNTALAAAQPCTVYAEGDTDFLVLNSAFHLGWQHGEVDVNSMLGKVSDLRDGSWRVAVVHHHLIPYSKDDQSQINNAYPLLCFLIENGFHLVLHGHRHVAMRLLVGANTRVVGVGSLNYPPESNFNNQFNILEVGKTVHRFRLIRDSGGGAPHTRWEPRQEPW
jgi:3',5'-cyclic AMP phosphodiesterase CpdA